MNFNQLQTFLNESTIPEIRNKPKTFLGIARQPHYENVISNIYAFYFDTNEEHGLSDLFIQSLLKCIKSKKTGNQKSLEDFVDFDIETEYGTDGNGRIDLLLSNEDSAIIIENKIYHYLNNDLEDYWSSVVKEGFDSTSSIGLVMSLKKMSPIQHPQFVNITHKQFMSTVMENLGNYFMQADEKYITFLKDLYQNILNMSSKHIDKESFDFYYHYQREIKKLIPIQDKVQTHVMRQLDLVPKEIEGLENRKIRKGSKTYRNYRFYYSKKIKSLKLTVSFRELLNVDKQLTLKIVAEKISPELIEKIKNFTAAEKYTALINNQSVSRKDKIIITAFNYSPSNDEIYGLKEFVIMKLKEVGFLSLFKDLEELLSQKQSTRE